MAKVSDLVLDVKRKLANREDVPDLAPSWIRDSVWEITDSVPFTELEEFGPEKNLIAGTEIYKAADFVNPEHQLSMVIGFEVFTDYPTNTFTRVLRYKEPMAIRPLSRISGLPCWWSRFSNKFVIASKPDKDYLVSMMYQRKHPFIQDTLSSLGANEILVPDSWLEIVVFSSALRGAMELRLPDYITLYHQILHGDPEHPEKPGLLTARMTQHQRDKRSNEGQIVPVVSRYTAG